MCKKFLETWQEIDMRTNIIRIDTENRLSTLRIILPYSKYFYCTNYERNGTIEFQYQEEDVQFIMNLIEKLYKYEISFEKINIKDSVLYGKILNRKAKQTITYLNRNSWVILGKYFYGSELKMDYVTHELILRTNTQSIIIQKYKDNISMFKSVSELTEDDIVHYVEDGVVID